MTCTIYPFSASKLHCLSMIFVCSVSFTHVTTTYVTLRDNTPSVVYRSPTKMATGAVGKKYFKCYFLLNHWSKFKILPQKCSSLCPLPKLPNCSAPPNKMADRAVDKQYSKQHILLNKWLQSKLISQKCSSLGPLQNLLKQIRWPP